MQMYEVGGCVRDELLGVPSKDIDFTVVLTDDEQGLIYQRDQEPFEFMANSLVDQGFEIFLETPEFLTVRARFPRGYWTGEEKRSGMTADFVLARKESDYTDGRRPDKVVPGTLEDDLARRDFTMNAIAKDSAGTLIDPFNGRADIKAQVIRCVGDPHERFEEDALRAIRALRFSITKGFKIAPEVKWAMQVTRTLDDVRNKISDERIMDELNKAFKFDTIKTLMGLEEFPLLRNAMFAGKVNLEATMKQKGYN